MRRDDRVVVLGEDVGARRRCVPGNHGLPRGVRRPERVIDTPLDECLIAGVAHRHGDGRTCVRWPRCSSPTSSSRRSTRSFRRPPASATGPNGDFSVPLVIRAPYGGGVHGALYHSQSIEAFFAHVPGTQGGGCRRRRTTPRGCWSRRSRTPIPCIFLEHKKTYRLIKGEVPDERYTVEFGQGRGAARGQRT